MVHFGEFLKTWSLRSNSATRQVSFDRSKIGGKCQNWKFQMRHFGWFSNSVTLFENTWYLALLRNETILRWISNNVLQLFFLFSGLASPGRNGLPIMASAVGRNSPLLELTGVNSHRSSSLGRNMLLSNVEKDSIKKTTTTTVRSPLLESDDRESCV